MDERTKKISAALIMAIMFSLIPLSVTTTAESSLKNDDFTLYILGGIGYTIYIDNKWGDQELIVTHTAFGKGIFRNNVVRDINDSFKVYPGSRHIITVHPVFCATPFVNLTVTLAAGNKSLTRNGIQFFSKIHIFLTGPTRI